MSRGDGRALEEAARELYPWLTIHEDGSMEGDFKDTTPAEMDRRLIIMQELAALLLSLRSSSRGTNG